MNSKIKASNTFVLIACMRIINCCQSVLLMILNSTKRIEFLKFIDLYALICDNDRKVFFGIYVSKIIFFSKSQFFI